MINQWTVTPEEKLSKAFLEWLEATKKLWLEYEQQGLAIPAPIKRALTDSSQNSADKRPRKTSLRRPEKPEMPKQAKDDWLWIDVKEVSPGTIVLAILNEGNALNSKDLISRVKALDSDVNDGTIYNICANGVKENRLVKTDQGWELTKDTLAPVLYKNYVWGTRELFQKQDLAAFRRMAVRYLLETSPDGLQIMQIYRQLKSADWLNTPLTKDLIKVDLFVMKDRKMVKTLGHSKKWTLT